MRLRQLALCAGLALALTACGKQQSANERPPAGASTSAPTAAATQAAGQQKAAEQPADLPSKITRMNEDGSETVEDVPGDSGAHNPLLAAVASTVAASTSTASAATLSGPALWQEGVNYTRIVPAQPTAVPAGQVEVLEFFWYACPHCNAIDSLVESWKKTKPAYISFSRVHVMWNAGHRSLARLYYTLESMGKLDQLHGEVFKEIHVSGNPLVAADPNNASESERIQTAFVTKHGISESDFKKAYHSFPVDLAMQRADELVQRYRIDGVPTFVVNGKYVADVRSADGQERLLSLVGDLAAQEHKH
ncbi:MAG TPA: thiol:disulfide interchange protein DsbA/DsbL [Steroidobacteraceae bacterium]|nr:thiol:disulfide interchange protein DsbA/DsbL [Steroidobacteraceae bacterium]